MSLEVLGQLCDILFGSGIIKVEVVGNEKSSGIEVTYTNGRVAQHLFSTITIQEPKEEPKTEELIVEQPEKKN